MSWYNTFLASNIQYLFSMTAESNYVWNLRHSYVQVFVAIEISNLGRLLCGVEEVTSKFKILIVDGLVLSNVIPML